MTTAIVLSEGKVTLPESIVYAYASREELVEFVHTVLDAKVKLTPEQRVTLHYAQARDAYRHGRNMHLCDLAIVARQSVERTQEIVRKLYQEDRGPNDWLTNQQCNAVLSSIMEM